MALSRFTDSYALVSEVNNYMLHSKIWENFDTLTKEKWIKAVTQKLDNLMYEGVVKVDGQPLKFPRDFHSFNNFNSDNIFDESEQIRALIRAVSYQIEFDTNRNGIGFTEQSVGDENVIERQEVICRDTLTVLQYYIKSNYGGSSC